MSGLPETLPWQDAVELLSRQTGVVLLVGAADVGKTTLTLQAANEAARCGRRVAVLDTDLGQGEVGPPGTLGIVRLEKPAATLSELKPRAMAFVGDSTPVGHLLPVIQGVHRLVRHALEREDETVFVDTSGMVSGRLAEKLKLAKLEVLQPSLVALVEREGELERLGSLMAGMTVAPVVRVKSPGEAGRKSQVYRRVQRANRFRRHLEGARLVDLDAMQVKSVDAWLFSGTALPARQLQYLSESFKTPIPHGERTADGVFLLAGQRPDVSRSSLLQEEFGRCRVAFTPTAALQNLLVGLVGPAGHLADIALLQGVNFERCLFSVLTATRSVSEVGQLHFGRLRVRPDGSEIGRLRPSDL